MSHRIINGAEMKLATHQTSEIEVGECNSTSHAVSPWCS